MVLYFPFIIKNQIVIYNQMLIKPKLSSNLILVMKTTIKLVMISVYLDNVFSFLDTFPFLFSIFVAY